MNSISHTQKFVESRFGRVYFCNNKLFPIYLGFDDKEINPCEIFCFNRNLYLMSNMKRFNGVIIPEGYKGKKKYAWLLNDAKHRYKIGEHISKDIFNFISNPEYEIKHVRISTPHKFRIARSVAATKEPIELELPMAAATSAVVEKPVISNSAKKVSATITKIKKDPQILIKVMSRRHSEETKQKISAALKERYEKRKEEESKKKEAMAKLQEENTSLLQEAFKLKGIEDYKKRAEAIGVSTESYINTILDMIALIFFKH